MSNCQTCNGTGKVNVQCFRVMCPTCEMNIDDTKASAELNLAVATAARIEAWRRNDRGRCWRRHLSGMPVGFYPSIDMTDAWEAAELVGLFDPAEGAAILRQVGTAKGKKWYIKFYSVGFVKDERVRDTAPLAICAAIQAMAEMKRHNDGT